MPNNSKSNNNQLNNIQRLKLYLEIDSETQLELKLQLKTSCYKNHAKKLKNHF